MSVFVHAQGIKTVHAGVGWGGVGGVGGQETAKFCTLVQLLNAP